MGKRTGRGGERERGELRKRGYVDRSVKEKEEGVGGLWEG